MKGTPRKRGASCIGAKSIQKTGVFVSIERIFRLIYTQNMENLDRIKAICAALSVGAPLKIALKHAGVTYSEWLYWQSVASVVDYCREQKVIMDLGKRKNALARTRQNAAERAAMEERLTEADPESIALYFSSDKFRKEANDIRDALDKCETAKTKSILRHLTRVATSTSNAEISASEWYLERVLPSTFGKAEPEKAGSTPPIKVQFVSSGSETAMKRIDDLEREFSGERKQA